MSSCWPPAHELCALSMNLTRSPDLWLWPATQGEPTDIEEFMAAWGNKAPVVIVPTKYYKTPTDHFRDMGISVRIAALRLCSFSLGG